MPRHSRRLSYKPAKPPIPSYTPFQPPQIYKYSSPKMKVHGPRVQSTQHFGHGVFLDWSHTMQTQEPPVYRFVRSFLFLVVRPGAPSSVLAPIVACRWISRASRCFSLRSKALNGATALPSRVSSLSFGMASDLLTLEEGSKPPNHGTGHQRCEEVIGK